MAQYINSNKPFTFDLNFDPAECENLEITFSQGETEIVKTHTDLAKNIADTVKSGDRWFMPFAFSIEESNRFEAGEFIQIQAKIIIAGIQDYSNLSQLKLTDIL